MLAKLFLQKILVSLILLPTVLGFLHSCSHKTTNETKVDRVLPRDEQIKEAQVLNQEAQANYYNNQASNTSSFLIAYSAPITALVGVLVAVLTLSLQSRNAAKLEEKKWERTRIDDLEKWKRLQDDEKAKREQARNDDLDKWDRTRQDELDKWNRLREDEKERRQQIRKDELSKETRQAAADLIRKIAVAAHSMTWVLWVAKFDPNHFSRQLVYEHDDIMKTLYADIAAAQVVLASLDGELYNKTKEIVNDIYEFDGKLALRAKFIEDKEKISNSSNFNEKVRELGDLWAKIALYSEQLPDKFANMLDI